MKTQIVGSVTVLFALAGAGQGVPSQVQQAPAPIPYHVSSVSPNSRVWQKVTWIPDPFGNFTPITNSYTEIQTGMAHLSNGVWVLSSGRFQITATGAAATDAQHSVAISGNLNTAGSVSVITPEGKRLAMTVLGVSYADETTGTSVWVGETTDCAGELLPGGETAVFEKAFQGLNASVVYQNSASKFEQLVVLHEQLPSPALWSMNPATTWLQVISELSPDSALPSITQSTSDGSEDDHLDFGIMKMTRGAAFAIGSETNKVRVFKRWAVVDGRRCLVEQVPLRQIIPWLKQLPPPSAEGASLRRPRGPLVHKLLAGAISSPGHPRTGQAFVLPSPRPRAKPSRPFQLATTEPERSGFAIDYSLATTQTGMVFTADGTYLINSNVELSGTTVIEGGTVLKFSSKLTDVPYINLYGPLDTSKCGPYKMAVLTSSDDDSVGEKITGSSGQPSLVVNSIYLSGFNGATNAADWHLSYLRFKYALAGFVSYDGLDVTARNCHFYACNYGIGAFPGNLIAENVLFAGCPYPLYTDLYGTAMNVTADGCTNFCQSEFGLLGLALTNCIVTGATALVGEDYSSTNPPAPILDHTVNLPSASGVFQSAGGAASYYLVSGSTNRNAGTTNIEISLLADLQKKTTYPPIVYMNVTNLGDMTFFPQAQRDWDAIDIGFHYEPLDYVFGGCTLGNVTFQPGTAAAWFRTSDGFYHAGHGIHLADGKVASFNGTAVAPTWWTRYNTVQEQSNTNWAGLTGAGGITGWALYLTNAAEVHANFLHCSILAGEGGSANHFRDDNGYLLVRCSNSEFNGGALGGYVCSQFHTNVLFDRVSLWLYGGQTNTAWAFRNSTHHGGGFTINRNVNPTPVTARDCAFDGTSVSTGDMFSTNSLISDYDYNAIFPGTTNQTIPKGTHSFSLTNGFNWKTSWLGNYYLPTNSPLVNTGWVTADVAGLFNFTTQVSQIRETNSVVDIGYHSVATDALGNPLDSDNDLLFDYVEDRNGNGVVDGEETDPNNAYSNLDGLLDSWEYIFGLDPRTNNLAQPSERATYGYTPADWLQSVSGIKTGTVSLDNEGNVLSVSQ